MGLWNKKWTTFSLFLKTTLVHTFRRQFVHKVTHWRTKCRPDFEWNIGRCSFHPEKCCARRFAYEMSLRHALKMSQAQPMGFSLVLFGFCLHDPCWSLASQPRHRRFLCCLARTMRWTFRDSRTSSAAHGRCETAIDVSLSISPCLILQYSLDFLYLHNSLDSHHFYKFFFS